MVELRFTKGIAETKKKVVDKLRGKVPHMFEAIHVIDNNQVGTSVNKGQVHMEGICRGE